MKSRNESRRISRLAASTRLFFAASVAILASLGASAEDAAKPAETKPPLPATRVSTQEFTDRVVHKGGRVDFVFGDDRPFAQCHASTIAQSSDGTLFCAWFAGTEEKAPDVGIWLSTFTDGAWTPPKRIAKINETAHWNPVLFNDPKQGLFLFFKVGPEIPYWQTYWMSSKDNGKTWSEPVELVPDDKGGRGPVKNKPIILSDGTWLAPASTELEGWKPFADRSDDGGKTWARSDNFQIDPVRLPGAGAIQPTLWESKKGRVHALLRTTAGYVARSDSEDWGRTWTPVYATSLPNNNSGIDALALKKRKLLLIYNPIGEDWGARTPLNLAVSKDNGKTWEDIVSLETEEGEFSYPAIIRTKNGAAVCYTWKRERVRVWQIPASAL